MSEASNYLEDELLDHFLGEGARDFTSPATLSLAIFTDSATGAELEAGTLTNEVANSNGYTRQGINFNAASSGSATNNGAVSFTASGGNWGTIAFFAVMDSATHGAGNVIVYSPLDTNRTINDGDTLTFANTAITVTLA